MTNCSKSTPKKLTGTGGCWLRWPTRNRTSIRPPSHGQAPRINATDAAHRTCHGVPAGMEQNPEESIKAAVKYIAATANSFRRIPDPDERIKFILAAYNAGIGHITDAMALAGKNMAKNKYSGTIM